MNLVFFGSSITSLLVLKKIILAGHQVRLIITQPDRTSGRGNILSLSPVKIYALDHDIPIIQPSKIRKSLSSLAALEEIMPELNVIVAYGQIIPDSIIYLPKYNSINLHFSLLPKYRGASPVQWAILNGEKVTGISIIELEKKMDSGPLLAKQEVNILPGENAPGLESRLAQLGADLIIDTIARIKAVVHQPQDHTNASYAPLIQKNDGRIKWEKNAVWIDQQIRAFCAWPTSFTFYAGKRIKILRGKYEEISECVGLDPGTIKDINNSGIQVCCGNRSVFLIEELQPENKKPMNAYAFSLGANIKPGDRFI